MNNLEAKIDILSKKIDELQSLIKDNVKNKKKDKSNKIDPTSQVLFDFFKNNLNKALTKGIIREQKFVHKNNFKQWFNEIFPTVEEMAKQNGYRITEEPTRGGYLFKLETLS